MAQKRAKRITKKKDRKRARAVEKIMALEPSLLETLFEPFWREQNGQTFCNEEEIKELLGEETYEELFGGQMPILRLSEEALRAILADKRNGTGEP